MNVRAALALLALLALSPAPARAANEFQGTDAPGKAVYFVLVNAAGQFMNGTVAEAENDAHWTTSLYCIAATEQGTTSVYTASAPSGLAAGDYTLQEYEQVGGSPATSDTYIGAARFAWSGTAEITNSRLTNLDATVSSRQPAGNVTVGGYATGQDPATLLLVTPGNKIATNSSNQVSTTGGGGSTITDAQMIQDFQSALWNLPGTFTQDSNVTLQTAAASGSTLGLLGGTASAVWKYPIGHGLTAGQIMTVLQAVPGKLAPVSNSWNASTHVLTTVYQFQGDTSATVTTTTQYPSSQITAPPVSNISVATGLIAQP